MLPCWRNKDKIGEYFIPYLRLPRRNPPPPFPLAFVGAAGPFEIHLRSDSFFCSQNLSFSFHPLPRRRLFVIAFPPISRSQGLGHWSRRRDRLLPSSQIHSLNFRKFFWCFKQISTFCSRLNRRFLTNYHLLFSWDLLLSRRRREPFADLA